MHRAKRVFVLFDILYSYFLGGSAKANNRPTAPIARHRPLGFGLR
jgi:hypothetical protein